MKRHLKPAMSAYLRTAGYRVVPMKKWLEVFRTISDGLPDDCLRRVVDAAVGQVMVVMCWEASLNDLSVHIVTPDGKVHAVPPL